MAGTKKRAAAQPVTTSDWTQLTLRRSPMLIAERSTIATWTGEDPIPGWVLHYWGHATGKLPKHLQPNGAVGHQYLACADDKTVAARYAEIATVLRAAYSKLEISGPDASDPKLISLLQKKQTHFAPPKENGMTLALERQTAFLVAENALNGDTAETPLAVTFMTPAGTTSIVCSLEGRCHIMSRDGGTEILFVACPKSGEQKTLAAALAGAAKDGTLGTLTVASKELVIASARAPGKKLAASLGKDALVIPCKPGTYTIRAGYDYPVQVMRLTHG